MAKIKKFSIVKKPNKKTLFRSLPGWKFDEGVWIHPRETNRNFTLPQRSDLSLDAIPESFYQSGVVGQGDLELDELNFEDERLMTGWTPGVRRGQYFSHKTECNLHGTESLVVLASDLLDESNRSIIDLDEAPHPLLPITAEYLQRNPTSFAVESAQRFKKVAVFKGVASNGRELDGDQAPNTDTSKFEFKLEKNDSDPKEAVLVLGSDLNDLGGSVYEISKITGPVSWWKVAFTRPDIFKNELAFDVFIARQVDPVANGALVEGDYCIGYKGHWSENMAMRVYLPVLHLDYGRVSFKPTCDTRIIFNQNVQVSQVQVFENGEADRTFYLDKFPVLDLTTYQDGGLAGPLQLDSSSVTLTVAGVQWARVEDLGDQLPGAQAFELDPLYGVIKFGDGGISTNGALPVGQIEVAYTQVPLVQYDIINSRELFDDSREDLDPQVNALKQGFLVLDNKRLLPYKITLSANGNIMRRADGSCCYGPLNAPARGIDDLLMLQARVVARGLPEIGVPNIPVQFKSLDGLASFSQEFAITNAEGYAYTEALGAGQFERFVTANWMYRPMDRDVRFYLNPRPWEGDLIAEVPPWGAHLPAADTLTVGERFNGELSSVYLLIQSIPSNTPNNMVDYSGDPMDPEDFLEPYDGKRRLGGLTVVWSQTVGGAEEVVHPIAAAPNAGNPEWTDFQFPINIPTGHLIVAYKLVIDRTAEVIACTIEEPMLSSNTIEICTQLNEEMQGQWKLPNLLEPDWDGFIVNAPEVPNLDGSRISSAVYMSPNDFLVVEIQQEGGGGPINSANVGDALWVVGTSFPTTEELYVSVYIIKTDADDKIVATKDISDDVTFLDATTIKINALPEPPTEEYNVNYWIAVGGFHPKDLAGDRKTAKLLQIGAAP